MRRVITFTKSLGCGFGGNTRLTGWHNLTLFAALKRNFYTTVDEGSRIMSGEVNIKLKPLVAVCQMTATSDKQENFLNCRQLIEKSKARGAQVNL
jgi:hypothetical protein